MKVAFGRQAAAKKPMVLWDLNPCNPGHDIYKNYIDKYKTDYVGGYQYEHFTISDNLAITPERLAEIKSQYVEGSIWYRRDILGERCIAEGLIYPEWETALADVPLKNKCGDFCISIDYGTMNAFAAMLWEKQDNTWCAVREYYYSGRDKKKQKTDDDYWQDIDAWCGDIEMFDGGKIPVIIDPSAASFIALLRKKNRRYKVMPADNDVLDGIRNTANAIENGVIKVDKSLKNWQNEVSGYVWDSKATEDKPLKEKDHLMDSMRYFVHTKKLIKRHITAERLQNTYLGGF